MAKKGGTQSSTVTTQLDPETQKRMQELWRSAGAASGVPAFGPSPYTTQAADITSGYARQGTLGMNALAGDTAAVASFMNPFQSGVIDQVKSQFGDLTGLIQRGVADQATKAGAFGGSRHGLATGAALGEAAKGAQSQISNLLYGGFNDAMGRAGQVANFGFGATGQLAGLGDYMRRVAMSNDPNLRRHQILLQTMGAMPSGAGTTTQTLPTNRNAAAGALGGAATGAGIASALNLAGPWGWGLAGLGGLLGLF